MLTSAADIVSRRLRNQKLIGSDVRGSADLVAWMGAVQAQDYPGAKWALALRSPALTNAAIDRDFDVGRILRTHVMRPTWHFVTPADIGWMVALTKDRVLAVCASYYRRMGLDAATCVKSRRTLERILQGGRQLTRPEIAAAFSKANVPSESIALGFLLMRAELEGVLCSGPRRGKQFTYALVEERVPPVPPLSRDESLATLARRYFTSHGPATVRDFSWWSGLTMQESRAGVDAIAESLAQETIGGLTYWFAPSRAARLPPSPDVYLFPNYDESGIAYRDRAVVPVLPRPGRVAAGAEGPHLLWIGGEIVGRWARKPKAQHVVLEMQPFRRLTERERRALAAAATRFSRFMELEVELRIVDC
jgi:DNA glycosylase AlkZ-like